VTVAEVREAYTRRAAEYTALFGSMSAVHDLDRQLVAGWAARLSGPVVDAGCGPGHWTDFLRRQGCDAEGVDLVPTFIAQAQRRFPGVPFRVASLDDLGLPTAHAGGVLAWYSLIHVEPAHVPSVLAEFARCTAPGGGLLLGLFEGPRLEAFPHAVTTAYFWPVDEMTQHLAAAGFEVDEVHTRTDPGTRPLAALVAHRSAETPMRVRQDRRAAPSATDQEE
jgi:SAM-dependent methyltransferase